MEQDGKVRILLVDDKPETLMALELILAELGEEVVKAQSGKEALRQLLTEEFAVIILDVNMPEMDGFETADLIRQRKRSKQTPIIFLTAFSDQIFIERGYSLGAVDYIPAPVVPQILKAKVAVFADLYRKTLQLEGQAVTLQQRASQLRKLTEISWAIASAPSLEAVHRALEDGARVLIGAGRALALFELTDKTQSQSPSPKAVSMIPELAMVSRVDKPIRIAEKGDKPEKGKAPRHTRIVLPLLRRDRRGMGLLYVADKPSGGTVTDEDEALLVELARIASIAMENLLSTTQLAAEIAERQKVIDQLKRSHEQLRELANHLESVREDERSRIVREINETLTRLGAETAGHRTGS